jgi:hypothetical protein
LLPKGKEWRRDFWITDISQPSDFKYSVRHLTPDIRFEYPSLEKALEAGDVQFFDDIVART